MTFADRADAGRRLAAKLEYLRSKRTVVLGLIVGRDDTALLRFNRQAQARLQCANRFTIVPADTHLPEESGTLATAAELAPAWFTTHFGASRGPGPVA